MSTINEEFKSESIENEEEFGLDTDTEEFVESKTSKNSGIIPKDCVGLAYEHDDEDENAFIVLACDDKGDVFNVHTGEVISSSEALSNFIVLACDESGDALNAHTGENISDHEGLSRFSEIKIVTQMAFIKSLSKSKMADQDEIKRLKFGSREMYSTIQQLEDEVFELKDIIIGLAKKSI